jgi:hypothetical protein
VRTAPRRCAFSTAASAAGRTPLLDALPDAQRQQARVTHATCGAATPAALSRRTSRAPLALCACARRQMDAYVDLLLSWNEKLNLVAASQASREQARRRCPNPLATPTPGR